MRIAAIVSGQQPVILGNDATGDLVVQRPRARASLAMEWQRGFRRARKAPKARANEQLEGQWSVSRSHGSVNAASKFASMHKDDVPSVLCTLAVTYDDGFTLYHTKALITVKECTELLGLSTVYLYQFVCENTQTTPPTS